MGTVTNPLAPKQQQTNDNMKIIALSCLLAIAAAAPAKLEGDDSVEQIAILRDERYHPEDGAYSFDFETENGIVRSEQGSAIEVDSAEVTAQQGSVRFTHPDGESFELTFVADENGYQPSSDALPVAPAFPHPIPDFVLEQIEFARNNPLTSEELEG